MKDAVSCMGEVVDEAGRKPLGPLGICRMFSIYCFAGGDHVGDVGDMLAFTGLIEGSAKVSLRTIAKVFEVRGHTEGNCRRVTVPSMRRLEAHGLLSAHAHCGDRSIASKMPSPIGPGLEVLDLIPSDQIVYDVAEDGH